MYWLRKWVAFLEGEKVVLDGLTVRTMVADNDQPAPDTPPPRIAHHGAAAMVPPRSPAEAPPGHVAEVPLACDHKLTAALEAANRGSMSAASRFSAAVGAAAADRKRSRGWWGDHEPGSNVAVETADEATDEHVRKVD